MIIILTVLAYFLILLIISRITGRRTDNDTFFTAGRRSPWYMVAFGMVGASISGVSFISVPGMVVSSDMTYLQMCLGFIPGYFAVAFLLLPVFYRLQSASIYSYLDHRFGSVTQKTGSSLFLISKMAGTVVKFYVVCTIMQRFVCDPVGIPFHVTVIALVLLIWLYTRRGGIKTLVWTDTFQTICMFGALILIILHITSDLGLTTGEAIKAISNAPQSHIFNFSDWHSRSHFLKQFISGAFIVIVMTGLDQDMMQKNMTCKTLADARKDMCTYGFLFLPANLLLLSLGILLVMLANTSGIALPHSTDEILPMFAAGGLLGTPVVILFTIGIVAACFSSADSALTSITTSFCLDILERPNDEKLRKRIHIATSITFAILILIFDAVRTTNLLDAIYTIVSYTYGPLLGFYAYGLLTRRTASDRLTPFIAIAAPLLCFLLSHLTTTLTGYRFGYELLLINGAITFTALALTRTSPVIPDERAQRA